MYIARVDHIIVRSKVVLVVRVAKVSSGRTK